MTAPVIIDIIAAALLIGFTLWGAKRGLFRALAGLLAMVLALAGARLAAEKLTPPVSNMVSPIIEGRIEERLDAALEGTPDLLAGDILPEELLGLLGIEGERLEELAGRAMEGVRETGASILSAVAESLAESMIYSVIHLLAFFLLTALLNLAVRALDLAFKLPVLREANALGGAAVGLVEGALAVLVLAFALKSLGFPGEGSYILKFAVGI